MYIKESDQALADLRRANQLLPENERYYDAMSINSLLIENNVQAMTEWNSMAEREREAVGTWIWRR